MTQALRTEKRPAEVRPAEEVSLRVETAGYGGVRLRALVPLEALSGIERGDFPVEATLKVRLPGYGWHVVGVLVFAGDEEATPAETRPVRLTVPGYGRAPLRMIFLGRAWPSDSGR